MKRSHDEIAASLNQFSLQFNIRGAAIRKTGRSTVMRWNVDPGGNTILAHHIYTYLVTQIETTTLSCYDILYYDSSLHGWAELARNDVLSIKVLKYNHNALPILDILLDDTRQLPSTPTTATPAATTAATTTATPAATPAATTNVPNSGQFAIGMWHSKTAYNLVSLRRSATQLGARFVFSIADRMRNKQPLLEAFPGDQTAIPVQEYSSLLDFSLDTIKDEYEWVCIEMGGVPLSSFVHPKKALYILGSEDCGVSAMLKGACKHVICLDAKRSKSFNVAVAGTMVMYDRYVKSLSGGNGSGAGRSVGSIRSSSSSSSSSSSNVSVVPNDD